MKQKIYNLFDSITIRIIIVILILLLPISLILTWASLSYMNNGVEQLTTSRENLLDSYLSAVDQEMTSAEYYMDQLIFSSGDLMYLTDRSASEFFHTANQINQDIRGNALFYQYVSGFFVYAPTSDFTYTYVCDSTLNYDPDTLREAASKVFPMKFQYDSSWQEIDIGGTPYLVQGYYHSGVYGGSFLNLDRLSQKLGDTINVSFGEPESPEKGAIQICSTSDQSELVIFEQLPREQLMSALPFLQRYILLIAGLLLLCIPILLLLLRSMVLKPLHRLTDALGEVKNGELNHKLETVSFEAREFREADTAFNRMTSQIHDLKIAVYEEKLENEHTRLQNLSYQLRPHFMINCLNMAYNMILSREYDTASRLMRFSAGYMRYLLKTEADFVPLSDELTCLSDYMNIQLVRYEGQFSYECQVDPFVQDIEIPSMVLQNFLENSVKYSITPDHFTKIRLQIDYCEENDVPSVKVLVRDNGKGYPEWLLTALAEQNMEALHDRIGLRNTMQRIRMLYGGRASYHFYNDNGAVTCFVFPLDFEES